jgi:glycosyltransferase involved in cell wall biosynthesis
MDTEKYNQKLLTLAIPTYNRASILDRALYIIRSQLEAVGDYVEFIVSDNCSPDNTKEIVQGYIESGMPINYIRNKSNIGPSRNIVNCYKMAQGKYVWVLSDDDYLSEKALEFVVNILNSHKDYGLIFYTLNYPGSPGFTEYNSRKDFFQKIDYMILWISGNILRRQYYEDFPFEKYINEKTIDWNTSAHLSIHVLMKAEYNVYINERIISVAGHGGKTSGGVNIFQIGSDLLKIIKSQMKILKIGRKCYEKNKYIIFNGLLKIFIENIYFKKQRHDYKLEKTWKLLFKNYWYLPYFYGFFIRTFFSYRRYNFNKKLKKRIRWINRKWKGINDPYLKRRFNWRYKNFFNDTIQANWFNHEKVLVGHSTSGDLHIYGDCASIAKLCIGNNCIIGEGVQFFLSMAGENIAEAIFKGDILIGDNVKIGNSAIIYPGVHIGDNVIIYPGSVVTESVTANAKVSGNPAKKK